MSDSILHVGVVGMGIGQWHVESFSATPGCRVVALCDTDDARLKEASSKHGVDRTYADYRELCRADDVDVVSVCVPNSLHSKIAVAAFEAGKHVVCEKPLANTVANARAIVDAKNSAGTIGMTAMKLRYGPEATHIRRQLDDGALGDIYYGWSTYLRGLDGIPMRPSFTRKASSGGGALIDNGVHLLDLTWYLMGCPDPVSVCGMTTQDLSPVGAANREKVAEAGGSEFFDVEDFGCGIVRFANGAAAMLENGWSTFVTEPTFSVRVLGTEGGATLGPFSVATEKEGAAIDQAPEVDTIDAEDQFAHFARRVRDGIQPNSTIEQGYRMVQMLAALYESHRTGRSVDVAEVR